jgi:hypothetical protein
MATIPDNWLLSCVWPLLAITRYHRLALTSDSKIVCLECLYRVRVILWLAVYRQSVRLGIKPLETHVERFFFSTEPFAVIALMYHPLWREDGFVSYEYAWPFVKCTSMSSKVKFKVTLGRALAQLTTPSVTVHLLLFVYLLRSPNLVVVETCLQSHSLATDIFSVSEILALNGNITISNRITSI